MIYIIWGIVIYCVIKVLFNFVIPLIRVTSRMRRQVREFQRQANAEGDGQFQNYQSQNRSSGNQSAGKQKVGEYIDFEEIKD
jgi:hypothetical protein